MTVHIEELKEINAKKDFFIGVDSDGCVFDSMELKHKECFCPAFINNFNLQGASKYAREAWEFVNLYSKNRGCNRFIAVIKTIELLKQRDVVRNRIPNILSLDNLINWVEKESKLSQATLQEFLNDNTSDDLLTAFNWSVDVSTAIKKIVHGLAPIPGVRECLETAEKKADIVVVSQTPVSDLKREWDEHEISKYTRFIAGQEYGTKTEHLKYLTSGKYKSENILMIGDAPGDRKSAKDNGILFFPIVAGQEELSWQKFKTEAMDKFFNGTYAGAYEKSLIEEFENNLPENPNWI